MLPIFEAISRYRYLVENSALARASQAADKLKKQLRMDYAPPVWLAGIGTIMDSSRSRAAVEVSIKPGYHPSNLPAHIDGIPVVVARGRLTGNLPF